MKKKTRFVRLLPWFFAVGCCTNIAAQNLPRPDRIVVASSTACRAQPDLSAMRVAVYEFGDVVEVFDESQVNGEAWYYERRCWIYGPLTTEIDSSIIEGHGLGAIGLAAADYLLQKATKVQFEDYVAAENLLLAPIEDDQLLGEKKSGLLQFRRLNLVKAAIEVKLSDQELYRNPWKKAWQLSHNEMVVYFDSDDRWYIRPEPYWAVYDQYPQEPWAEELAWTAAQLVMPSDECYADCVLGKVERTYLQYWRRRPNGVAIHEALKKALEEVRYAATEACPKEDPKNEDYTVPRPLLDEFRKSLTGVSATEKQQLLTSIDQIERQCY